MVRYSLFYTMIKLNNINLDFVKHKIWIRVNIQEERKKVIV
jgi:hypothetical protein